LEERERLSRQINRDYDEIEIFDADLRALASQDRFTVEA
jgi:hypothetical protein